MSSVSTADNFSKNLIKTAVLLKPFRKFNFFERFINSYYVLCHDTCWKVSKLMQFVAIMFRDLTTITDACFLFLHVYTLSMEAFIKSQYRLIKVNQSVISNCTYEILFQHYFFLKIVKRE